MSMPYILMSLGLFEGDNRASSEETILYLLEVLTDRNVRYLLKNPNTPKLYDSGVVYALPEQMMENKIPTHKLKECSVYLKNLGASEETIDVIMSFLQGIEIFRDIPTIIKKGKVDCDNLACWRAAELRVAGIQAKPYIIWRENGGGTTYHALLVWPDGTSEDPSLLLGMGGAERDADRQEERRKNKERFDNLVEAARIICDDSGASTLEMAQKINSMGLLPVKGAWPNKF